MGCLGSKGPGSASQAGSAPAVATADDVLQYWFSGTADEQKVRHWKGLKETDDEIRDKFLPTWSALSDSASTALADEWAAASARSALALIIVWDQFSRALWRGDARSFSNDGRAGALSMEMVKSGRAAELSQGELAFAKMPLLHTEDVEVHRWNATQPGGDSDHVQGHLKVVERFGRFPKRNQALGRESTPEEVAYMESDEAKGRPY